MNTRSRKLLTVIAVLVWMLGCILLLITVGECAHASDDGLNPFDTQEVSLTYRNFFPDGRDPLINQNGIPNRALGDELVLTLNTDIMTYFYWNNNIHAGTDKPEIPGQGPPPQFRTIGWQFQLGARVTSWLSGGYYHHSQHVLDTTYAPGFPVEDAFEVKLTLVGGKKEKALFSW